MMKILMIVFAALMMTAVATVGALKWLGLGPFAGTETVAVSPAPPPPEVRYVDMEPLVIPLIQGDNVAATVQIELKLETLGDANASKLKRILPRLADAFLRELHAFLPRLLREVERLDVGIVKQRLQMVSDRVAGPGLVSDVLIQSVNERPGS